MKVIDKLNDCFKKRQKCFSFEYYPPKTEEGLEKFYPRIMRMSELRPCFIDVTWGTGDPTSLRSIDVSQRIQAETGIETMMHLTCTDRSKAEIHDILKVLESSEIQNIMALRGNAPNGSPWQPHPQGFEHASELVSFIREKFGDHFCISVAAYPEGHRDGGGIQPAGYFQTEAYEKELLHLRAKVDAGADFIVTQLCFQFERLAQFVKDCRQVGIRCPIIPGILPIHNMRVFNKIATFSATIPENIAENIMKLENTSQDVFEDYACGLLAGQIGELQKLGFSAIHLYTLNYERVISRVLNGSAAFTYGSG